MVLKWIQKISRGAVNEATQQGANEETKKLRRLEGRDIAHEVLLMRARKQQAELSGLVRTGIPNLKKEHFKSCVKNRVFEIVSESFNLKSGPELEEITEEITGQIVAAADVDPTYEKLFDQKD